jgi:hypothetical protein
MSRTVARVLLWATLCVWVTGCKEEVRKQLYFNEPKPPLGVGKVEILSDQNMNLPTGGEITLVTVVEPNVDRDELDRMLKSFYRQVKVRRGFHKGDRPEKIDLRFYTSKKAAEAGGEDWLARVEQISSTSEPTYTNRQKPPLLKWVNKVLKPSMAPFTGDLKPQILADATGMTVEVTWPFVKDDGSGQPVEKLSYALATQTFYGTVREVFEQIEGVKKVTFIGKHGDEVVMKIWMSRDQYAALDMTAFIEKELHAFQGQFVELLLSRQIKEKVVERKTAKRRREVFREIFSRLPAEQVELAKDLR